jgi:hypothetical protein
MADSQVSYSNLKVNRNNNGKKSNPLTSQTTKLSSTLLAATTILEIAQCKHLAAKYTTHANYAMMKNIKVPNLKDAKFKEWHLKRSAILNA